MERRQILKGERHGRVFKLGDRVRVRVDRVNRFLLQVEFSLVETATSGAEGRRRSGRRDRTGGRRR